MHSPIVLREKPMELGQLIEELESMARYAGGKDNPWVYGLTLPHAYRGSYTCLAFHFAAQVRISDMFREAHEALGHEFKGYKGELWTMRKDTPVYIAHFGELGVPLTDSMLGCLEAGDAFWHCFEYKPRVRPAEYGPDGDRGH